MSSLPTSENATEPRWSDLTSLAPTRPPADTDAVDGCIPSLVVAPANTQQVSALLAWANNNGVRVIARGGGTKLAWGNVGQAARLVLSLENFARVMDHAWQDMTVTVEAGTTVAALQAELAKHGQRLPLDVLWPERSTVGGVIATNDSGALRLRFGSVRDLILGVTAVLADGTIAKSGGRVVKNVAGYDLPKLFTGSFGTLGVITEVTLRTYPLPHHAQTLSFCFPDPLSANRYMLAIADTNLVPAATQMHIARETQVNLLFEGLLEGIAAQVTRATQIANGAATADPSGAWQIRDQLCTPDQGSVVLKFSVLPSAIADAVGAIRATFPRCEILAQSLGLGVARCEGSGEPSLGSFTEIRAQVEKLGGTLSVLSAPLSIKKQFDVFGTPNSSHAVMVRVKQQFDPKGILSPGRYLGGI